MFFGGKWCNSVHEVNIRWYEQNGVDVSLSHELYQKEITAIEAAIQEVDRFGKTCLVFILLSYLDPNDFPRTLSNPFLVECVNRVRTHFTKRGMKITSYYQGLNDVVFIDWSQNKRRQRLWKGIVRFIVATKIHLREYYKPGGRGAIVCQRDFEKLLLN